MQHSARYPPDAFRGFRSRLPDLLIGLPSASDQSRAVRLLNLQPGQCVIDASCASGFNLARLVRAVGAGGAVIGVEDNAHLLRRAQARVRKAGWSNVRFVDAITTDDACVASADGIIVSYDPPILLQRPDLLEAAWSALKPGGRLTLVAGRCTTRSGKLVAPFVRAGLSVLGHGDNWRYWTVHEPWAHLSLLAEGNVSVWPRLGFQYLLCAEKPGGHASPRALSSTSSAACSQK